jgi:CubicO group peptidase (beta-lactamase class C family)
MPRSVRITLPISLAMGLLVAATGQEAGKPSSTRAPAAALRADLTQAQVVAQLEKHLPQLMKDGEVPGLAIALVRDGDVVWHRGFGVKNSKTKAPVDDATVFEAASLSKPVCAYAVLKLADSGKFDLDKPLNQYLPGNHDVGDDPRLSQITARHVLSHTTGFPNWRSDKILKIHFKPGERFSYSGEGFVYLSKVIERVTREPFDDFMKHTVFQPLGMTSSSYVWQPSFDKSQSFRHNVLGYVLDQNKPSPEFANVANAAASLRTTAQDYGRFLAAVLKGTGLKPETRKLMLTPQVQVCEGGPNSIDRPDARRLNDVAWGLGWGLQTTADGLSFWHWGDQGDSKAYIVAFDRAKLGVVVFTNSANGLSIMREIVTDAVGGNQPAMEWLDYERFNSPRRSLLYDILAHGADEALREFRARRDGHPDAPTLNENQWNSLGYDLLGLGQVDDAIEVFAQNVEDYPASWNAYDSLAEAYEALGEAPSAIRNYKRSLELNPKNAHAETQLKKLVAGGAG